MTQQRAAGASRMKRAIAALSLVGMAALAACGYVPGELDPPTDPNIEATLKVLLVGDATPQSMIDRVNSQFNELYPNVDVQVEVKPWEGIYEAQKKLFMAPDPPCVSEVGNTLITGFADPGMLTDLTDVAADLGEGDWVTGMAKPGLWDGSRWSIPYYGGVRVILYNKAHFAEAGVQVPTTYREFTQVLERLAQVKGRPADGYSPFYFPGKNVYGSLPFVWALGGGIATQGDDGTWTGRLTEATSRDGLTELNRIVQEYSAAPRDANVLGNATAFASGKVGMMLDLFGEVDRITAIAPELDGVIGTFALPGVTPFETAPVFTGGSDLAIPNKCAQKGLALEWIKLATNLENQTFFAGEGSIIPNNPEAFGALTRFASLTAGDAVTVGFFTPVTPQWDQVERFEILPKMLVSIFTGTATVDEATAKANQEIETILNAR